MPFSLISSNATAYSKKIDKAPQFVPKPPEGGQAEHIIRPFDVERLRFLNLTAVGGIARPDPDDAAQIASDAAGMVEVMRIGLAAL